MRRRVHRSEGLIQIENQLQSLSRSEEEDVVLRKGKQDIYKDQFLTAETWNHIRTKKRKGLLAQRNLVHSCYAKAQVLYLASYS